MKPQAKKIIIIGAGFGGLAASAVLAQKGHDVTILEKNNEVGGRATTWGKDGFLFDLGPSWYLMPDVFEAFFARFGKKTSDYYRLKRLDPSYRVYFSQNKMVDLPASLIKAQALFDQFEPQGGEKLQRYLKLVETHYHTAMDQFIRRDFLSLKDFLDPSLIKNWRTLATLSQSFHHFVSRKFKSDEAQKILEYVNVFLGGSPQNTPALYAILSYVDFKLGVWYPLGGFGAVPKGMAKLAKEQGVKILLQNEVKSLIIDQKHLSGVKTESREFKADIVIANSDYPYTETQLVPPSWQSYPPKYWSKKTIAPSALLLFLGIKKRLNNLRHHNLVLAPNWLPHFDSIFQHPSWPKDPSYYVCAPSKTDPAVAPQGMENLFILVPVAAGLEDSDQMRNKLADQIISHLSHLIHEDISSHLVVKRLFSHRDFISRYHAYQGTALGMAHTLSQTAFFRPKIKSAKLANLYYCGAYPHPGIGTAPSVISGEITADSILKSL